MMATEVLNGTGSSARCNGLQEKRFSLSKALESASRLLIHGGNIANWNRTKRKTTPNPSDELCESITTTLNNCLPVTDNNNVQKQAHSKTVRSVNNCFVERIDKEERVHLKISVKLFAIDLRPSLVKDALFRAMCELGVDSIESFIISRAKQEQMTSEAHLEGLKQLWEEMEELYDCGYVKTLGTCDLDKETLEKLHEWARIKPEINQVNLASCCVMPKDLVEYSKIHDIQLLTHADPQEILTDDRLQQIISGITENGKVEEWKPTWVARYSVLVKCRGVIKNKAYIVKCERQ